MREIIERLHENRQIELARSILESNGYAVEKEVQLRPILYMWSTKMTHLDTLQDLLKSF